MSILRLLYQTLCTFLQIKDRNHIEQSFHSVAGVMPQGWGLEVLGGSKILAWGFAMAPHWLCILVLSYKQFELREISLHILPCVRCDLNWWFMCQLPIIIIQSCLDVSREDEVSCPMIHYSASDAVRTSDPSLAMYIVHIKETNLLCTNK